MKRYKLRGKPRGWKTDILFFFNFEERGPFHENIMERERNT